MGRADADRLTLSREKFANDSDTGSRRPENVNSRTLGVMCAKGKRLEVRGGADDSLA